MQRIKGRRTPLVKFVDWYSRRTYGKEVEPFAVMANSTLIALGYGMFEFGLERSRKVDQRLETLAATKVAANVGCAFCMDIASHLSRNVGVTDQQLRELHDYRDSKAFGPLEKLVLEYSDELCRTPVDVPDKLFARLSEHFDQQQIVELTAAIAFEGFRSRFNRALRIPAQGFSEGGYCVLPASTASTSPSH